MINKQRRPISLLKLWSLCFFSLAFIILHVCGCGGGSGGSGSSSADIPSGGTIVGKVIAPEELALKLNIAAATGGREVARAMVWLDSQPDRVLLTDATGAFSFTGVPATTGHRVICRFDVAATGEIYLSRSAEIRLDSSTAVSEAGSIQLEKGLYTITGVLRNQFGAVLPNVRMSLWGIPFKSGSQGCFITPPMPESAALEAISIAADGYRHLTVNLPFLHSQNTASSLEITLSDNSEPNFSPVVFFAAAPANVAPGEKVQLKIGVYDPDELVINQFKPLWKSSSGSIESTSDPMQIWWTAPETSGLATVSVSIVDSRGAPGAAGIGIAVGGNRSPTVRIDSVQPSAAAVGTKITIAGSGFGSSKTSVRVSFNGTDAAVHSCSDSEIITEVPAGASTGLLVISCSSGEKSAGVFAILDSGLAITPLYGPSGTLVELSGNDFGNDSSLGSVSINGSKAEIKSWSDRVIKFVIPANSTAGVVTISLRGREKTAGYFKVTRIFNVSTEKATQGTVISISGEGFGAEKASSAFFFYDNIIAPIQSWSETKVSLTVPADARSGELKAFIQGISFPVKNISITSIAQITPARGIVGDEMIITGTGFGETMGDGYVTIGNTRADILSWQNNSVKIKIPPGTRPGTAVMHANGIDSNEFDLVISGITSIAWQRRPSGASVTINGYGFSNDSGFVLFGDVVSSDFSIWKNEMIEAVIPEAATGTAPISVSTMGVRTAPEPFFITWIDDIDQREGWAGREVIITGNNLGNGSGDHIKINGITAPVISWTNTEIHFRVPAKTKTGPLILTISNWPIVVEEDFTVYETYDYAQISPDWSGKRVNSKPLLPGLAEDASGNSFITDFDNGWIWKITADGTQSKFANLNKPWGIAISPLNSRLYVAESGAHQLQVFDTNGNFIESIGSFGSNDGEFSSPRGLTFDSAGRLYVADSGNSRIQVFNTSGVNTYMTRFGANGNGNGQFVYPSGVAVDQSLNLYIADAGNHRIQRFSPDSSSSPTIWSFTGWAGSKDPNVLTPGWQINGTGLPSSSNGGFQNPYGIGMANNSHLLIADTNNNRIQVIDTLTGNFVNQIGAAGTTSGQYNQPLSVNFKNDHANIADSSNSRIQRSTLAGEYLSQLIPNTSLLNTKPGRIVVDSTRKRVYVLDTDDGSITVFSLSGQVLQVIGSRGTGTNQFFKPRGIALDQQGNIFVADTGNARVQMLTPEGDYIRTWGAYGTGSGQFIEAVALALSADGEFVFVVDASQHRILKFSKTGSFVKTWGSYGSSDDHFNSPSGIAIDKNGNVYVADQKNHRIKKYTADGILIGWWGSYDAGAQSFWLDPASNKTGAVSDADGGFDTPTDVSVDSEGNVFVADSGNFRIQRFSFDQANKPSGAWQGEIYIGESLDAITVDDWATVYTISAGGFVKRFSPEL